MIYPGPLLQRFMLIMLGLCLAFGTFLSYAFGAPDEDELKATYIARFTEFIVWPPSADNKPFDICVLGADPIEAPLAKLPALIDVKGRALRVRRIDSTDTATSCEIVFVSGQKAVHMRALQKKLMNLPVLTVGDTPGLIEQGVLVNFYIEGDRLRFKIHLHLAQESGLKFSSRLLKIAKVEE